MLLHVSVADHAAGIRGRELDALRALVGEDFEAGQAEFDRILFLQFHFLAIVRDGPGLEESKLRLVIESNGGVTVLVASFGAQELIGAAMPRFNVAIVFDGGLLFVEQDDGE